MRESDSATLSVATASAMHALGERLGSALSHSPGQPLVVTLSGELGVGKTTLVRGVLRALGVEGAIRSPTYTLVEPYDSLGRAIYHLDLYRVTDPSEVEDLGVRDLLESDALLLIEWAERAQGALPAADLRIQIGYAAPGDAARAAQGNEARGVAFTASTPTGISVLTHLHSVKHQ